MSLYKEARRIIGADAFHEKTAAKKKESTDKALMAGQVAGVGTAAYYAAKAKAARTADKASSSSALRLSKSDRLDGGAKKGLRKDLRSYADSAKGNHKKYVKRGLTGLGIASLATAARGFAGRKPIEKEASAVERYLTAGAVASVPLLLTSAYLVHKNKENVAKKQSASDMHRKAYDLWTDGRDSEAKSLRDKAEELHPFSAPPGYDVVGFDRDKAAHHEAEYDRIVKSVSSWDAASDEQLDELNDHYWSAVHYGSSKWD